jgi:hypothetical protein
VSDRFHLFAGARGSVTAEGLVSPPEILAAAVAAADESPTRAPAADAIAALSETFVRPDPTEAPSARDAIYVKAAAALHRRLATNLVIVRFDGLDAVGHHFLRYAMPRSFGDVSEDERRRFGDVLDRYYRFVDEQVGDAMATLARGDVLLVVAGFGMEPMSVGKRLLGRALADPDLSGSHEGAPDGFLIAYGTPVAPGRLPLGSIVDVTPTVLYFFGLPVGRDMDGDARADVFTRDFTAARPITTIPSHEGEN